MLSVFANLDLHAEGYALKCQMHSSITCVKYDNNSKYRFHFPKPFVQDSYYDEDSGSVIQKRNHNWLNPFCPIIMFSGHFNQDIKCTPRLESNETLALVFI